MFKFEECSKETLLVEQEIMNSHPAFNYLSTGTEYLSTSKIVEEHVENSSIRKERYLVSHFEVPIGIIDFTMLNPNDEYPWIGLFIIHQKHTNGIKSLQVYKSTNYWKK